MERLSQTLRHAIARRRCRFLLLCLASGMAMAEATQPSDSRTVDEPVDYVQLAHPQWSRNAVIYQINTRQFTPEGSFAAASAQLPRLKALGADILWLMPIHPIGEKNRKGSLGSPYSVRDYYAVNPEFGSAEDLRAFIDAAHELGMKVIIDWVANHTAWDNALTTEHPEWYSRDWQGDFHPTPWWDWSDIIELDFNQPGLRRYMTEAMKHWVKEFDIDGFRCDVAYYVPLDFWENLRAELDAIKPVFMLAEADHRDLHARAFDMTYAWNWTGPARRVARGEAPATNLNVPYVKQLKGRPRDAYRMVGTTNHDYNAWEGTDRELFGDGFESALVLSFVGEGMPLIYNGQEAGLDKRLAFFEKDPIIWREHSRRALIAQLARLVHENTALWHGEAGGEMQRIWHDRPDAVFSFVRDNGADKIAAFVNFSDQAQTLILEDGPIADRYRDYFSGGELVLKLGDELRMAPHSYRVLVRSRR